MGNYSQLLVWQRARDFSIRVHLTARAFPQSGAPGLRSQLLRSAASISANIAEGAGQNSDLQFVRFVNISIGSANECENHLLLAHAIGFLSDAQLAQLNSELQRIRRMLYGLRGRLQSSANAI